MIIDILNYPKRIGPKHSVIHCANPIFEQELSCILERSGNKEAFFGLYKQRLDYLEETRHNCHLRQKWFERLKYDPKHRLYSMKFNSGSVKKNIRILFICTQREIILLGAFVEDIEQKAYSKNMKIANDRVNLLINGRIIKEEDIICHTK